MSGVDSWEAEYNRSKSPNAAAGPSLPRRAPTALIEDDDEPMPDVEEPLPDETPLEQLTRHWMNERHAPDILPAQDVLLSSLLDHIRRQVRIRSQSSDRPSLMDGTVGHDPTTARRSIVLGGGTHPHHARADRSRARKVHRTLIRAYTAFQGTSVAYPRLDAWVIMPKPAD